MLPVLTKTNVIAAAKSNNAIFARPRSAKMSRPLLGVHDRPPTVVFLTEPGQCECRERESEVPQRHIEIARNHEQIGHDQQQPCRHDISENAWFECDSEACHDLDHADGQHQLVSVTAGQIVDECGKVLIPIHQQVKKFVEPGHDGRDGKAGAQNLKCLIAGAANTLARSRGDPR